MSSFWFQDSNLNTSLYFPSLEKFHWNHKIHTIIENKKKHLAKKVTLKKPKTKKCLDDMDIKTHNDAKVDQSQTKGNSK